MAIAGRGWGKTTLDSESRARSNSPRFPWQTPRLTLTYWLTGTKVGSRSPVCQGELRPEVHSKFAGQGEIRTDSDDRFNASAASVDARR